MIMMMWRSVAAGVIATLSMDVLSVVALRLHLSAPLPPNLIGRWFAFIARGRLYHADIAHTPPVPHEIAIALPFHYAIGIVLTGVYIWALSYAGRSPRNLAADVPGDGIWVLRIARAGGDASVYQQPDQSCLFRHRHLAGRDGGGPSVRRLKNRR
jgi:hypothetical protein